MITKSQQSRVLMLAAAAGTQVATADPAENAVNELAGYLDAIGAKKRFTDEQRTNSNTLAMLYWQACAMGDARAAYDRFADLRFYLDGLRVKRTSDIRVERASKPGATDEATGDAWLTHWELEYQARTGCSDQEAKSAFRAASPMPDPKSKHDWVREYMRRADCGRMEACVALSNGLFLPLPMKR